jgi:hypothetical protein
LYCLPTIFAAVVYTALNLRGSIKCR